MKRRDFVRDSLLLSLSLPTLVACTDEQAGDRLGASAQGVVSTRQLQPGQVNPLLASQAFPYGVASGDPTAASVILWTAVAPRDTDVAAIPVSLEYVVSPLRLASETAWTDLFATQPVRRLGAFMALKERDWTIKIDLGDVDLYRDIRFAEGSMAALPAASFIYYRFRAGDQVSRTGRARTQPAGRTELARFAVASCSNLPEGFFSVYDLISQDDALDFVVHLGDYLYEYGEGEYGTGADLVRDGESRVPQPATEMITAADYVQRHAQYKRDRELQRLHAQFPVIAIWDDHEITNDSNRDGAENHTEGEEGSYAERKAAAIRAYFNWMPLREQFPRDVGTLAPDAREVIYRRLRVGDLMDLILLDTRIVGRDPQPAVPAIDPSRHDPQRSLLGPAQRQWLQLQLLLARNEGAHWTFLGQQVMFGQLNLVELPQIRAMDQKLLGNLVAVNMDQWDGYTAERDRVRDFVKAIGLQNLVVLTGDIHTSWAIELYENPFVLAGGVLEKPFGVELVAPSVTSPGFPDGVAELVSAVIPAANPHIRYSELKTRGYVQVEVTREQLRATWRYVSDIRDPARIGEEDVGKRRVFEVRSGSNRLNEITGAPSTPLSGEFIPGQVETRA